MESQGDTPKFEEKGKFPEGEGNGKFFFLEKSIATLNI